MRILLTLSIVILSGRAGLHAQDSWRPFRVEPRGSLAIPVGALHDDGGAATGIGAGIALRYLPDAGAGFFIAGDVSSHRIDEDLIGLTDAKLIIQSLSGGVQIGLPAHASGSLPFVEVGLAGLRSRGHLEDVAGEYGEFRVGATLGLGMHSRASDLVSFAPLVRFQIHPGSDGVSDTMLLSLMLGLAFTP